MTKIPEMVERVARTLAVTYESEIKKRMSGSKLNLASGFPKADKIWPQFVESAKSAIEAMSIPTPEMVEAANDSKGGGFQKAYMNAIEEALK